MGGDVDGLQGDVRSRFLLADAGVPSPCVSQARASWCLRCSISVESSRFRSRDPVRRARRDSVLALLWLARGGRGWSSRSPMMTVRRSTWV